MHPKEHSTVSKTSSAGAFISFTAKRIILFRKSDSEMVSGVLDKCKISKPVVIYYEGALLKILVWRWLYMQHLYTDQVKKSESAALTIIYKLFGIFLIIHYILQVQLVSDRRLEPNLGIWARLITSCLYSHRISHRRQYLTNHTNTSNCSFAYHIYSVSNDPRRREQLWTWISHYSTGARAFSLVDYWKRVAQF